MLLLHSYGIFECLVDVVRRLRRFILIAKSFGGDFKPSVPCIGESHPMHVKESTSLLAKEQGEIPVKWSASQTYGNGCMMSTPRGSP